MNYTLKFLLGLLCCWGNAMAQNYTDLPLKIPFPGFTTDTVEFEIVEVADQREDKSTIGSIYYGILKLEYPHRIKRGIPIAFNKYFAKAQKRLITGERKIMVAFREFLYTENPDNLNAKGGKDLRMAITVDYYEVEGTTLHYLFTDEKKEEGIFRIGKQPLNQFCYTFFKSSFQELNQYLTRNPKRETIQENKSLSPTLLEDTLVEENAAVQQAENTANEKGGEPPLRLSSTEQLPKDVEISRNETVITGERFTGDRANGLRFRYLGFQRKWNDFNWLPAISIDIEGMVLNNSELNKDPALMSVDYSYFALGLGTIKPLNNYFF